MSPPLSRSRFDTSPYHTKFVHTNNHHSTQHDDKAPLPAPWAPSSDDETVSQWGNESEDSDDVSQDFKQNQFYDLEDNEPAHAVTFMGGDLPEMVELGGIKYSKGEFLKFHDRIMKDMLGREKVQWLRFKVQGSD